MVYKTLLILSLLLPLHLATPLLERPISSSSTQGAGSDGVTATVTDRVRDDAEATPSTPRASIQSVTEGVMHRVTDTVMNGTTDSQQPHTTLHAPVTSTQVSSVDISTNGVTHTVTNVVTNMADIIVYDTGESRQKTIGTPQNEVTPGSHPPNVSEATELMVEMTSDLEDRNTETSTSEDLLSSILEHLETTVNRQMPASPADPQKTTFTLQTQTVTMGSSSDRLREQTRDQTVLATSAANLVPLSTSQSRASSPSQPSTKTHPRTLAESHPQTRSQTPTPTQPASPSQTRPQASIRATTPTLPTTQTPYPTPTQTSIQTAGSTPTQSPTLTQTKTPEMQTSRGTPPPSQSPSQTGEQTLSQTPPQTSSQITTATLEPSAAADTQRSEGSIQVRVQIIVDGYEVGPGYVINGIDGNGRIEVQVFVNNIPQQ